MKVSLRLHLKKPLCRNRYIVTALAVILLIGTLIPAPLLQAQHARAASRSASQPTPPPERQELTAERTANTKVFKNPNGTKTAEVSQFPIHYQDSHGHWQDVDTTVTDTGNDLKADKTTAKPDFKEKTDNQGTVGSIVVAGRTVTLKVKGAKDINNKVGQVERNGVLYEGVYDNTNLRYRAEDMGFKEDIILNSSKGPSQYDYELSADNTAVRKTAAGDLEFVEPDTGRFLFKLPKPYMYDNSNAPTSEREISEAVGYEVAQHGSVYDITLKADKQWLKNVARKFPITIDPTVTLNQPYYDGYADTCSAGTPHYSEVWMLGGTNAGCTRRSYVWFSNLPTLPAGSTVTAANLKLYQYGVSNPSSTAAIYRVNAGWNGTTLTWKNQPAFGSPTITWGDGTINNGFTSPDVKNIVTSWTGFGGTASTNGFMISLSPESGAGSSTRTWRTGNYPDSSQWPKLSITYTALYSAELVGTTAPPSSIAPGETYQQTFSYKNTGTNTWYADGSTPIHLGTDGPHDRTDAFYTNDGHWVSTNRVKLDQALVRPGDTGTFTMTMTAPSTTGTYHENFGVVAEGYSWLEQATGVDVKVVGKTYGSAWQGQGWTGGGSNLSLARGQTAQVWIDIKNTGNTTWVRDGSTPIRIGGSTSGGGVDRSSAFVTGGDWLSVTRPTATDKDKVAPGETARFSFVVSVPANQSTGTYNEYFRPVMDGVTWLTDQGIYIPINVTSSSVPSVNNLGDSDYSTKVGGVDVTSGNLNLSATDVSLGAKGPDIQLKRNYNSRTGDTGVLGRGWQFDFEQRLMFEGNNIRWISDDGQQFTYTGDGNGTYTRPANTQITLTKSDPLLGPVTYTLKDKKNLRIVFDGTGKLKEMDDQNGNSITYTYTNNLVSKITDASGRDITLTYNADSKLVSITDFANRTVSYGYTNGNLTQVTDPRNSSSTFAYDGSNRLTTMTDARGNSMTYEYDTSNRVTRITDAKELDNPDPTARKTTRFAYDSSTQTSVTDTKDVVTRYGFDLLGRVTAITNASVTPNTTRFQFFDSTFNKISTTDQNGAQTHSDYDSSGNVIRQSDELGAVTTSTYDPDFNNLLTTTDPKGVQQKFEYDGNGNKTKEYKDFTNEPTKYSQFAYDGAGNLTKLIDANNHETDYEYNANGQLTKEKAPPQTDPKVTEYTYDAAGNQLTVKDPLNHVTTYEYNANNQVTKQTDALGNVTQYAYDANGNKTSETDPKGQVTAYEYDKLNQLTKTTAPDIAKTTTYQYDKTGNVTQVADGKGQASTVAYDTEGKPVSETTNNVTTNLTYNAGGDVTRTTEGSGTTQSATTLNVDKAGQETKQADQVGGGAPNTTNNNYDANGNQTQSTSLTSGTTKADYDTKDQVKKETDVAAKDTNIQYDANGNVTNLTLPSGKTIAYKYDDTDQLTGSSVTVAATNGNQNIVSPVVKTGSSTTTEATNVAYDKVGNITRVTKANGTYSEMSFDAANRITGLSTKREDGSVISSYTYAYDANGNITQAAGDGVTTNYSYDTLDELTSASDNQSRTWGYAYDATGNRTQLTDPSGTTTYTYGDANDKNLLTSSTKGGVATTYSYDSRGNNTGRSDGTTIAYDANNLVTSAKIGNGPTVSYVYDTDKHLISRTVNGTTTRYQYDGDRLSAETDNSGTILVAYSYDEQGRLVSQTRKDVDNANGSNKVYYYHYDGHGNVTSLTDPSGTDVKRYQYDPFGSTVSETGDANLKNSFTFSGYFQDSDTKLYLLKARAYDSTLGRFLSVDPDPSNDDPKQDPVLNANLYLYTNNNPVTNTDDTGLGKKKKSFWNKMTEKASNAWNSVGNAVNNFYEPILSSKYGLAKATVLTTAAAVTAPWWGRYAIGYGGRGISSRVAARFWVKGYSKSSGRVISRYANMQRHFVKHGGYKTAARYTIGAYKLARSKNFVGTNIVRGQSRKIYRHGRGYTVKQGWRIVSHRR